MAWPTAATGNLMARVVTYIEGDVPLELTPVAGGTAIPFVHNPRSNEWGPAGGGSDVLMTLDVMARTELTVNAAYTYGGRTWTVTESKPDAMAGAIYHYRTLLEAHVA